MGGEKGWYLGTYKEMVSGTDGCRREMGKAAWRGVMNLSVSLGRVVAHDQFPGYLLIMIGTVPKTANCQPLEPCF